MISRCAILAAATLPVSAIKVGGDAPNDDATPSFLMVTGYWRLTSNDADSGNLRSGEGGYIKNMKLTMSLNTDQVIYGDHFGLEHMEAAREGNTAPLVGKHLQNFNNSEPCKTHGAMMRAKPMLWTHPQDTPSISLGCIWDGKMGVMADAARRHPGYDFYGWVDIGMHAAGAYAPIFRSHGDKPWPHPNKLKQLPHDKITISHSGIDCNKMEDKPWQFWHCAAATAFVVPVGIMDKVNRLFYSTLDKCMNFWSDGHTHNPVKGGMYGGYPCLSEQMIMSVMARENPDLFNWMGHGWGAAAADLTAGEQILDEQGNLIGSQGGDADVSFSEKLAYGSSSSDLFGWLGSSAEEDAAVKIKI